MKMKKFLITLFIIGIVLSSGCVTKEKLNELNKNDSATETTSQSKILWEFKNTEGKEYFRRLSNLKIVGDRLYVKAFSRNGSYNIFDGFYSFDPKTGELLGKLDFSNILDQYKDLILYHTLSELVAFNISANKEEWRKDLKIYPPKKLTIVNDTIYFAATVVDTENPFDFGFFAVDAKTGDTIWTWYSTNFTSKVMEYAPAYYNGVIYFIGNDNERNKEDFIYAMDAKEGKVLWKYLICQNEELSSPVIYDGILYIGTFNDIIAIDINTQKEVWRYTLKMESIYGYNASRAGDPLLYSNKLYIASKSGRIFCLDPKTGKEIWIQKIDGSNGVFIDNNIIYSLGKEDFIPKRLYALDLENGEILGEFNPSAQITDCEVGDVNSILPYEDIIFVSFDEGKLKGTLYALNSEEYLK